MKLCFTVDWEDWYHGFNIPHTEYKNFERRLKIGHYILLELLAKHNIKATYFLLGQCVDEFPELVKEIQQAGHELACHTYTHPFLTSLSPQDFRQEIIACKNAISPFQNGYRGFRAPYFSVKEENRWILEILKEEGFSYDSSIFSGNTFRSGIKDFPAKIHNTKEGIIEFPISNFNLFGMQVGIGGAYNRILPYNFFKKNLIKLLKKRPCLFYFHPWEFDYDQPYIKGLKQRVVHTHFYNLKSTRSKIESLFKDFEFYPLQQILAEELKE